MKNDIFQKLIYKLVSNLFVFPIYKFVFQGHLIGAENIPKTPINGVAIILPLNT